MEKYYENSEPENRMGKSYIFLSGLVCESFVLFQRRWLNTLESSLPSKGAIPPARASGAKVARVLDTGLPDLPLAPFHIKCTTKGPNAISTRVATRVPSEETGGRRCTWQELRRKAAKRSVFQHPLARSP